MGIEGIGIGLLTRLLGMGKEEVEVLVKQGLKDMDSKDINGYLPL